MLPSHFWMSSRRTFSSFATAYTADPGKEHLANPPSFCLGVPEEALLFRKVQPRMDSAAATLLEVVGKDTASRFMTSEGTATGN